MEIPIIKDKITARAYALGLAIETRDTFTEDIIATAQDFEKYLIGNVELPEISNDPTIEMFKLWKSATEEMKNNNEEFYKKLKINDKLYKKN